ncbi:unnamed protein product, partial [Mesorhabditis spiculigera]
MAAEKDEAEVLAEQPKEEPEKHEAKKRDHREIEKSPSPAAKRAKKEDKENGKGDESVKKEEATRKKEKTDEKSKDVRKDKEKEREKEKDRHHREKDTRDERKDRDRDRERDRRRSDDKDKDRRRDSRKEDDRKRRDKDRKDDKGRRKSTKKEEEPAAPVKKAPTARDLERLRQYEEEMAKEEDNKDEEGRPVWSLTRAQAETSSRQCPYLDTIDRNMLDFDFEKLCSVSLSHLNVYACMVCGKYFQGRGTSTYAYTHSLDTDHRIFLNLQTLKFYCLPDMYEVIDPSLEDIKYVLKPTFTDKLINALDGWQRPARAYDNTTYFPGVVGLNNIKANDYENVILHALSHVTPLRNYFLKEENYSQIKRPPGDKLALLSQRFGELVRKLWNTKAFKAHVSPHEMLQAIVVTSQKRFQFTKQGDAADFMSFFLNTLHLSLNGTQKNSSSIIYKTFRGKMRQYTRKVLPVDASSEMIANVTNSDEYNETAKETPFLFLSLDLPPPPLYVDAVLQNIIPQVPLQQLLAKFNGATEKEYKTYKDNFIKRFEILELPNYLIIVYQRFKKNQFFVEKNPTIVNFPISNIDLYDALADEAKPKHKYTTYDLVANIVHDGKPSEGRNRVQIHHKGTGKWFEMEDLHVKDILPQMITLAESYIQIWKLNRTKTREERMGEDENSDEDDIKADLIAALRQQQVSGPQLPEVKTESMDTS